MRTADPAAEPPGLKGTLVRTLTLGSADTSATARRHADLVIKPADTGAGFLKFRLEAGAFGQSPGTPIQSAM